MKPGKKYQTKRAVLLLADGTRFEGDGLGRAILCDIRQDARASLRHGKHIVATHAGKAPSREKSPDLPPLLRRTAIPSIRIERSTAFNMS